MLLLLQIERMNYLTSLYYGTNFGNVTEKHSTKEQTSLNFKPSFSSDRQACKKFNASQILHKYSNFLTYNKQP